MDQALPISPDAPSVDSYLRCAGGWPPPVFHRTSFPEEIATLLPQAVLLPATRSETESDPRSVERASARSPLARRWIVAIDCLIIALVFLLAVAIRVPD